MQMYFVFGVTDVKSFYLPRIAVSPSKEVPPPGKASLASAREVFTGDS